jgi:hypothetical protein
MAAKYLKREVDQVMEWESLLIWPQMPALSIAVLALITVVVLYCARPYAHKLIYSMTHYVHKVLRLTARSIMRSEARFQERNREVLLGHGVEAAETKIDREFQRISDVVNRDLESYPPMHRSMSELVTTIDEDYKKTTDTPPPPPEWLKAVEAVNKLGDGEGMMKHILSDIKKAAGKQHDKSLAEYRKASGQRHALLKKMAPYWRKVSTTLESTDKSMRGLSERAENIDKKMGQFEEVMSRSSKAERILASSALTQFVIATVVLMIAIGGAIVNFNLIALPMSEMVGGGNYIGPFQMNEIAAMVIVLVEAAMGIFLMEALRITNLFPIIHNLEDVKRRRFMWVAFSILLLLACVEASLAFMRDIMAAERQAMSQMLSGVETEFSSEMTTIPMIGQMVLGFMLPFVLAFVAIPFESFIHSARTVLGIVVAWLMRFTAFLLRLIGSIMYYLGNALVNVYDLMAFPLLWIEKIVRARQGGQAKSTHAATDGGNRK